MDLFPSIYGKYASEVKFKKKSNHCEKNCKIIVQTLVALKSTSFSKWRITLQHS
jgi:hypothetical protein